MSLVVTLAKRFLTGKKRNTFISFVAAVSLFGVSLGVAALVVVMAVMEGFETELRSIITGTHSHIVLYSTSVIPNRFELAERIQKRFPEVQAASPFVFSEVMVAKQGRVVGAMLEGLHEASAAKTTQIERHLVHKMYPSTSFKDSKGDVLKLPTIVLGSVLAEKLAAQVGDEVSVISPFFEQGTMQPRVRRFVLAGLLATGMYEYDSKYALVTVEEAVDFFRLPLAGASALRLRTADPTKSSLLAKRIRAELGSGYILRDWTELNRNLLYAIKLQKVVIFIVLTSIIVVAAFNIMSTLVMMMSEKKREMSILKAMGMKGSQSAAVFTAVGLIIGISGAVAGLALGGLIAGVLGSTKLVHLPPDVYFISYLPVDMQPLTLGVIALAATLVALLATLYPAYSVAVTSPVEGLRYE